MKDEQLISKLVKIGFYALTCLTIIGDSAIAQRMGPPLAADGYTPAGVAYGGYSLDGFAKVNEFSGSLSFVLPVSSAIGRGEASFPINLRIDQQIWVIRHFDFTPSITTHDPTYHHYNIGGSSSPHGQVRKPVLGPGKVILRRSGDLEWGNYAGGPYVPTRRCATLSRLTYISSEGGEIELVDRLSNGSPNGVNPNPQSGGPWYLLTDSSPPKNRGSIFDSIDGSSLTFIADNDAIDITCSEMAQMGADHTQFPSGALYKPNGVKYRVENGRVTSIVDVNGNKTTVEYSGTTNESMLVTDSIGRQILINDTESLTTITKKGYGGTDRVTKLYKGPKPLRAGLQYGTYRQQFPGVTSCANINGCAISPSGPDSVVSAGEGPTRLELPNGQSYFFYYNPYGELARVDLPTGGAYEYDYAGQYGVWTSVGEVITRYSNHGTHDWAVSRRVTKQRTYDGSGLLESETTYFKDANPGLNIETRDRNGNLLSKSKVYHQGSPLDSFSSGRTPLTYNPPFEGQELKREVFDVQGNLLMTLENTWEHTGSFLKPENERLQKVEETLNETGLVTKKEYSYGQFNNIVDVYEYDYGVGQFGQFLRRTHTDYVTDPSYTSDISVNLKRLPLQAWVSSDIDGSTKASLTQFEYDNYNADTNHAALTPRSSVVGHDTGNYGATNIRRGNVTTVTSYANAQTQTGAVKAYLQYDILGNVVKTIDANGNATSINYNDNFGAPDGEAQTNTPPSQLNGLNTFAFPKSSTNALGWVTGYTQYDYFTGQPVNIEDLNGVISKTIYNDLLDRPTQTVTAIGTSFEMQSNVTYDYANRRIEAKSDLNEIDDNLLKSESFYDGFGRTIEARRYEADGGYVTTKTEYDALGRAERVTNPFRPLVNDTVYWTETSYDSLGRITRVRTPDSAEILTSFSGNTTTVTDQAGKQRRSVTNALGQLIRVDEPDASGDLGTIESPTQPTHYYYNTLGKMVRVNQGVQNRYFMHDSLGRLLRVRQPEQTVNTYLNTSGNPDNNSWTIGFTYDNNGNLLTSRDANNVVITSTYDALNRPLTRSYSDSTPTVTYTYDDTANVPFSKGRLTKVFSTVSETRYTEYDEMGRLEKSEQRTDGEVYPSEYKYNLAGALIEQKYPSGRVVKNVLDASGDISMIQSKRNENFGFHNYAKHFTYNAAGAVTSMQLGNGLWETAQFNSRLQSTQLGLGALSTGANLWKVDYEFGELQTNGTVDAVKNSGNIALQTLTVPGTSFVQSYTYDSLYRLTEATEKTGTTTNWSQQFGYDRYGNRTSLAQDIGGIAKNTTPAVDANTNRFTSTDFGYDANGNIVEDIDEMTSLPREFIFNGDNKQTEVKRDGVTIGRYYYDGEGRRVKKVTDSETTVFVYAGGQLVAEYSTAISQTPSVSYTTADHLGSPRVITNELGQVSSRRDFMPFGEELYAGVGNRTGDTGLKYSPADDDIRQKFTGYQKDNETNLDFAEARMYQNLHGRFTAVDPIFIKKDRLLDPQRINLYLYVRNNPLKFVDNSGEDLILANAAARTTFRQVTRNGLSRAERNNIRILTNGRVVLRNPNAVDTQNASYAYQQIAGIIGNRNLTITVYAVAKGETAIGVSYQDAFESAGITFGSPGDAQRDVVIPVGGGVPVCANPPGSCGNPMGSGNTVATTEDTIFAHEVFGHANGNDGDDAITAENNYRRSRNPAIGERSGEDHRYTTEVTAPTELISTTPAEIQTNLVPKPMLPLPTPPPKRPE